MLTWQKNLESVVHIFHVLPYKRSILWYSFRLLTLLLSEIWLIIQWQTDGQMDRQNAMYMSPLCNVHRWAKKRIIFLNKRRQVYSKSTVLKRLLTDRSIIGHKCPRWPGGISENEISLISDVWARTSWPGHQIPSCSRLANPQKEAY